MHHHLQDGAYARYNLCPGAVIANRSRLWGVDGQEDDVLIATSIDGCEAEQYKSCVRPKDYQPVPVVMALEMPCMWRLIADGCENWWTNSAAF